MNNDIAEGKWKQLVGKAKAAWGELTDDELTKAEGRADRLAGLIQERYGKTREDAENAKYAASSTAIGISDSKSSDAEVSAGAHAAS